MPQLFYSAGSPYARICRMALREGGLMDRVEEAETTLRDPAAVMLPHNPVGRVPALLLEDATTLTETTLVLSWLDRMGSAPRMLPEDASGIAAYGRVLGLLDGIAVWNREMRRPEHERSSGVIALEEMRATRIADALERNVAAADLQAWMQGSWHSLRCLVTASGVILYGAGARGGRLCQPGLVPLLLGPLSKKRCRH